MGATLKRNLGPVSALQEGEYTVETASGMPVVCCPRCAGWSEIEQDILIGGVLAERWRCPYVTCGHEEWLTLESLGEDPR